MALPFYEEFYLGPAFDKRKEPRSVENDADKLYLRHKREVAGYCCKNQRCQCFLEIHEKVGRSSLEIIKDCLVDLRLFMKRSTKMKHMYQLWKRKEHVFKMVKSMRLKAQSYDSAYFQQGDSNSFRDFECPRLFMLVYRNLEDIVDGGEVFAQQGAELRKQKLLAESTTSRKKRCNYCAKPLKHDQAKEDLGCDNIDRLVKFFVKGTIFVAEKEMDLMFETKYNVGKFCAMIISQAKDDVMIEMEDPPMVMASHVLQATAYELLTEMTPKQTDIKDMTQDELRRIGTRLQRIQARSKLRGNLTNKQNLEDRLRTQKITHLIEEMGTKWRMSKKEKSFEYSTKLFAKSLVQERVFGISIYSGFISKEHELLLCSNKYWLMEIESVVAFAVSRVARKLVSQILKQVIYHGADIDVIFHDSRRELNYSSEQVNIAVYMAEARYLSTCCYYCNDIVEVKVQEFRAILKNMRLKGLPSISHDMSSLTSLKKSLKFEVNSKKIKIIKHYDHADVTTPFMRWGDIVIYGEPPIPRDCRPLREEHLELEGEAMQEFLKSKKGKEKKRELLTSLLRIRRGIDTLLNSESYARGKQLQGHLSHVQESLTDQIAAASQSISQNFSMDSDHIREFHRDDLYNVEFYATHKMNVPFLTLIGIIVLFLLIFLTGATMTLTTIKSGQMNDSLVLEWLGHCFYGLCIYGFVLEPVKAVVYALMGMYVD